MTTHDEHARTVAGMLAAVEYARTQYHGMSGAVPAADAGFGLEFIRADCERGDLDLTGALAGITLRAAQLHANVTGVSVEEFLDALADELTPPDDASALG